MENNKNNEGFRYIYSAKEQEELRYIRAKYTQKPETVDKMERVRRLDAAVTYKAQAVSLIFGIIGTLILGLGMSMCMTTVGEAMGIESNVAMIVGICVGVLGGLLVGLAYPIYNLITKRERKKIAPEILRLTEELLK